MNKKVVAMFEKAEDEYNDLMSKKNIIEVSYFSLLSIYLSLRRLTLTNLIPLFSFKNDKSKIKKVIEELDEKKKETLKVTWVKVNT